jgi:Cys-tRNA(Pro)/Cys-tRNA(Cys) deacylase
MPGDRQLSMKRLAKACGRKRAAMADTKTAERLTGYLVGGISPFGTRQKLAVVMDTGIAKNEKILINAGQRGKMILMSPVGIQKALTCTLASVSQ